MNWSAITFFSFSKAHCLRRARLFAWGLICLLILASTVSVGASVAPASLLAILLDQASWDLLPEDWVGKPTMVSATAIDSDGLQEATAEYRFSTDGGSLWSDWLSDTTLEHHSPVSTTVYLTATIASLVDSETANQVEFRITDLGDSVESSPAHTVKVDSTAPNAPISLGATPSDWTNQDDFTLAWTNPGDLSGIAKAYYKIGGAPPSGPGDASGSSEGTDIASIGGISLGGHGHQTVYVWLEDAVGNSDYTHYGQVELWLDLEAPAGPTNLASDPAGWTSVNSFDLSWTSPPQSDAPIDRAYYKFGSAPTHVGDYDGSRQGVNIWQISNLAVPGSGEIPCYVWLEDAAGNADHTSAASVTLYYSGGSAPSPPFAMQIDPSTWDATGVYTVTWANPPAPSGIRAAWYKWGDAPTHSEDGTRVAGLNIESLEGLTRATEGQWNLHVWLEDGAGNKDHNNRSIVVALYDRTPPVTTYAFTPPLPASGWFRGNVDVTLQPQDALSGVRETWWRRQGGLWRQGNSFTASEYSTYDNYSVDNAGNQEATKQVTVPIDTAHPTSEISLSPPVPPSGWHTEPVVVTISAVDDLSGWDGDSWYKLDSNDWVKSTEVVISENGSHSLEYYSSDVAGNEESAQFNPQVCRIDRELPTITATPDKTGEHNKPPVVITLEANDLISGVEAIEYRRQGQTGWTSGDSITIDGSLGDGVYTYEYRARDVAGNVSNGEISLKVDGTPPSTPTNLDGIPGGWVNANGHFGLGWANPVDFSGVAGVYYQFGVDPTISMNPTYVAGDDIEALSNLSVPGEGQHTVYIWLQDAAGNQTPYARAVLANAFKLDVSAPTCEEPSVDRPPDRNGYYTGPVNVTFVCHDTLSGLEAFYYRDNGGDWTAVPVTGGPPTAQYVLPITGEERHIIECRAGDVASNDGLSCVKTVRIDSLPPGAPTGQSVTPSDWTSTNSFTVSWSNPTDYSGIGAVYVKKGSPPTANDDGELHSFSPPGQSSISGITVGQEGQTFVYIWLKDVAGNVDHTTAVSVAPKYDATPPETSMAIVSGTLGKNGYYVSPVTFSFSATDSASGVAQTRYRINNGPERVWNGQGVVLDQEGTYSITFYSDDHAENVEQLRSGGPYKIDLRLPTCDLQVSSDYVGTGAQCVHVEWSGEDTESGIEKYTLEYRQGGCGPWRPWLSGTAATSGDFCSTAANHFYYFRIKAEDRAGHVSGWSPPDRGDYAYLEGLGNADFRLCDFGAWASTGVMDVNVPYAPARAGGWSCMARLGNEEDCMTDMPIDSYASLYQSIQLPSLDCDIGLVLSFWYRILSYDVSWGLDVADNTYKWFDPFEVTIRNINGHELASFMPVVWYDWERCVLWDSEWRPFSLDLTPWAGQTIRIDFRVWNRVDQDWPTWAFVDDVKLTPALGRVLRLPLVYRRTLGVTSPAGASQPATSPEEQVERRSDWPESPVGRGGRSRK